MVKDSDKNSSGISGAPHKIWEGPYTSWPEEGASKDAFSDKHWLKRIAQQLVDYRDEISRYGTAHPPRPCGLPLVCAFISPKSIVDFGGSSGWCWDYLQNVLPGCSVNSYIIVEVDEVRKYMQESGLQRGSKILYKSMENTFEKCELLYANSILQYFESNQPLLQLLTKVEPKYIFLEEVVANPDKEDYFGLQAYYEHRIPYRFIGLESLIKDLKSNGYNLVLTYPYLSPVCGKIGPLPMTNFPEEFQVKYTYSMLFRKSDDDENN